MDLQRATQDIGTRLQEARTAKGLSQAELGRLAGFNKTVVQKIERGTVWHPSVVAELAVALDVNPAWLQWGDPFSPTQIDYCQLG